MYWINKIVLKTHLLSKYFAFFTDLQKICQYNKNLRKQKSVLQLIQTNKNYKRTETLKSSKVYFIKKNKLIHIIK